MKVTHSNPSNISDHVKQAEQSWGAPTGTSEWNDERAGEEIAKAEQQSPSDDPAAPEPDNKAVDTETAGVTAAGEEVQVAAEPEQPEDNSRSYADYLAEQAEKKLKLGVAPLEARKANEGTKQNKQWAQAKPLSKDEEDDEYIAGKGEKAKRERQRKEKQVVDVDFRYNEPSRGGERGRGRGRGGRGRGEGFRGRGDGGFRGGRGGREGASVNVEDENAFPSLKA